MAGQLTDDEVRAIRSKVGYYTNGKPILDAEREVLRLCDALSEAKRELEHARDSHALVCEDLEHQRDKAQGQVRDWISRFHALTNTDTPAEAGNVLISTRNRLAEAQKRLERVQKAIPNEQYLWDSVDGEWECKDDDQGACFQHGFDQPCPVGVLGRVLAALAGGSDE